MENKVTNSNVKSPLISILIYNYDTAFFLERCLESIFKQKYIENFEVIICDDASIAGTWDIACQFSRQYEGMITLCRNHHHLGTSENKNKGRLLSRGKYCVELSEEAQFDGSYVLSVIQTLQSDEFLEHSYINRLKSNNYFLYPFLSSMRKRAMIDSPLVSICVYNYNYGRYLRQCLDSIFAQTYQNIEVSFSDNASDDESWEIALEYARKYPNRVSLIRNRQNFGANVNIWHCMMNMNGKYMLKLCSDDALQPAFVERCVSLLESHADAAFAMVHREIIDENNVATSELPFYEQSCLIPGAEQAAVYMMSSVNPSVSQIFYRVESTEGKRMAGNLNDRWFGDRIMDFHICCESPIVYIKEPLLLNRIHSESDSASLDNNLLQCLGEYVLVHQLADIATTYSGMDKATARLPTALDKLGGLCLRYCLRTLINGDELVSQRYYHLALAIFPTIQDDELYKKLTNYWNQNAAQKKVALAELIETFPQVINRTVSYPIPSGSIAC